MMASQGPTIETAAPADPNSLEKYQGDGSQVHALSYYPSTTGSASVPWSTYATDKPTTGYGSVPNSSYQHDQQTEQHLTNVQNPSNVTSLASSNPGTDTTSQVYTGYATYQTSSNPYSYAKTGYSSYYSDYQQPPNQPYSQPVGVYQNSVAPYQPHSSYQNTGSYAGTAGYSSTYYNPGDYQTPGTYTGSGYSNQTNTWSQGNYAHYSQQYPSYSQDSSSSYSSNLVAASVPDYQQQYKQWVDYYNQTEVTCAPGTENTTVPSTSSLSCPIPGVSSGYSTPPVSQPQPSYTPSWKPEYGSSTLPSVQTGPSVNAQDGYWQHGAQPFQNPYLSSAQPSAQNPVNVNPTYPSVQEPQQMSLSTPSSSQYPSAHPVQHTYQQLLPSAHQVQQIHQQPTQSPPFMDARRVNKLQIPTNPRIASNLGLGLQKTEKDGSATGVAAKPAYVSVSVARPNDKVLSSNASDPILKPGMFPASLRGYVERALARCKDEKQMAACQEIMKEMITKATTDGTLHTRDWDMEPLFPLPDASTVNKEDGATSVHSLPKFKRSPSRRTKSRWEPLPEEKLNDKSALSSQDSAKSGGWHHFNGRNKFTTGKFESKDGIDNKFSALEQTSPSKSAQKPVKRRRFGRELSSVENGDASSGSDKEQDLTAYYSGAISLADSPEERKRRENRSKRFERTNGQRSANHFRPKTAGAGNLYTRRATALVLSKNFEDAGSRAVEDIDWDALTVKGTCQEIEKRYLRLTSAPDPSTVRPEEVLEKALHMVHNSQKNYLYKCDQLKSIRQDLTVQRIRNELTVKVYETHARLALEFGDLPEYNQCQSQLKSLYGEGIAGCHMEFSAYNLLAVILHSYNRKELLSLMSRLSDEAKRHESVKHALKVRAAVTSGNYVMFFRLYKTAPNLNTYLMDLCVEKMRFEAVKSMSRAYRPTVPVSYITQVLGFSPSPDIEGAEEKDVESMEECTEWLKAHGACLITDNNGELQLDTKASASSLYMPEPEDAVAHGDANLAVNDFLTRTPI